MKIRRVAQQIDNLKRRRLLPGDPIRVDRIHNGKISSPAEFAHNSKRIVKISFDRDDLRSVHKSLHQFTAGNFSGRQNDCARDSRPRRISRRRCRCVSGRRTNQGARFLFERFGNRDRHPAILE